MSKITSAFQNKKIFIPYIMAADPSLKTTEELISSAARAGAGLIEIGIPFSDPVAEGPVIQKANVRALKQRINFDDVFKMTRALQTKINIPFVFMTYLNPVFNYGYERFFSACAANNVSGIIVPDMPFEEQGEIKPLAKANGIDVITLVAPSSSEERIKKITEAADGFIYLVSSYGVTGVRKEIGGEVYDVIKKIKKYTNTPVAVGFGVSTQEQARALSRAADGVIVGSAIVKIIEEHGPAAAPYVEQYIKTMVEIL